MPIDDFTARLIEDDFTDMPDFLIIEKMMGAQVDLDETKTNDTECTEKYEYHEGGPQLLCFIGCLTIAFAQALAAPISVSTCIAHYPSSSR